MSRSLAVLLVVVACVIAQGPVVGAHANGTQTHQSARICATQWLSFAAPLVGGAQYDVLLSAAPRA